MGVGENCEGNDRTEQGWTGRGRDSNGSGKITAEARRTPRAVRNEHGVPGKPERRGKPDPLLPQGASHNKNATGN